MPHMVMRQYFKEDFNVPSDVKRRVQKLIREYEYYDKLRKKNIRAEEYIYPGKADPAAGLSRSSFTSDPTFSAAERIEKAKDEIEHAGIVVSAIDDAISEASGYSYPSKRGETREMLRKNLIDRVGRDYLGCSSNLLSKYRRITFYLIADKMDMI